MWTGSVWIGLALVAMLTGAACVKKPVVVTAEPPPLAVPVVPPRLVGPVQVEEAPPPPVDEAPERPASRAPTRTPRVTRSEPPARPADGGTAAEPPKADPPEPATTEAPPNLLRTAETADDREATRRVKEVIGRTEANLSKVNYKGLSTSARAQHDNITLLIAQAEEALNLRCFTFARYLADKAEVLSGSLANR